MTDIRKAAGEILAETEKSVWGRIRTMFAAVKAWVTRHVFVLCGAVDAVALLGGLLVR